VTPGSLVEVNRHFGEAYCLHHHSRRVGRTVTILLAELILRL
jgi:hypothetical protein